MKKFLWRPVERMTNFLARNDEEGLIV